MSLLKKQNPQSLTDRIEALRAEIEAYIDEKVEAERKTCPGIPAAMLRSMLMKRDCPCAVVLRLEEP